MSYLKRFSATCESFRWWFSLVDLLTDVSRSEPYTDKLTRGGNEIVESTNSLWNSRVKSNCSMTGPSSLRSKLETLSSCCLLLASWRAADNNLLLCPKLVNFTLRAGSRMDLQEVWVTELKKLPPKYRPLREEEKFCRHPMRDFILQTDERRAVKCFWRSNSLSSCSAATFNSVLTLSCEQRKSMSKVFYFFHDMLWWPKNLFASHHIQRGIFYDID